MPLPPQLMKSALLGTARQPYETEDAPAEGQLLLTVARNLLREKAGYLPERMERPLPDRCAPDTTTTCSESALEYLRLILSGRHRLALIEWLVEAIRARRHVREDFLPRLLLLGQKRVDLRPYLLSLVGQRGMWLALEIRDQNWKWVFDTPESHLDDLIQLGQLGELELRQQLTSTSFEKITPMNDRWLRHRHIWSQPLMELFLERWETAIAANSKISIEYYSRGWIPCIYFFPLSMRQEATARLVQIKGQPEWFIDSMKVIYNFRERMIQAVHE